MSIHLPLLLALLLVLVLDRLPNDAVTNYDQEQEHEGQVELQYPRL